MMAKGMVSCYEAYMNHAGDKDLKKMLKDLLDQAKLEIKECDELLTDNGIALRRDFPKDPRPNLRIFQ